MIVAAERAINQKQGVAGPVAEELASGSASNRAFLLFMAAVFCYKVKMYKKGRALRKAARRVRFYGRIYCAGSNHRRSD
jgi:hypothetical protein